MCLSQAGIVCWVQSRGASFAAVQLPYRRNRRTKSGDQGTDAMWPDELYDLVAELNEKIRRYGDTYRSNETATRYSLIDPVLAALGWDLSDTSLVLPEYPLRGSESGRGRSRVADYAMLHESGRPQFFVEAKNLGTEVDKDSPAVEQAINYTIRSDCEYVVITNGDAWEAYRPRASGELHERRTTAFRIENEDRRSTVTAMLWLWRWRWESDHPVTPPTVDVPIMPPSPVAPTPHVEFSAPSPAPVEPTPPPVTLPTSTLKPIDPTPPDASSSRQPRRNIALRSTGIPLSEFRPASGESPPQIMVFPDGVKKPVGRWNQIQVVTVEWLIDSGRLTESECPLTGPNGAYLVHTTPYKQNGALIRRGKQVGGFWIDLNFKAGNQVRRAKGILTAAGVDPATVFVSSSPLVPGPSSQSHPNPSSASPPRHAVSQPGQMSAGVPLSQFSADQDKRRPELITFQDGKTKPIKFWYGLQIAVVEWLAQAGRLTEFDCPVKTDRGAHIVHTTPVKQNGRSFDQPRQIGKYWIDSFPDIADHVRFTKIILQRCGVDPATVYVS